MADKEQADRFLKEAQALSAIKHRGIIEVIGFGNLSDGRQYMVMEFLEGEPLESVMDREGSMSPARALPLIDEILSGLAAAHKAGVVHRDLKPSNVFISLATSGERNVKVLDFGLAKQAPVALEGVTGQAGAKSSLMAGTPEYIAPEQARGLAATPQTDLYCLGVMLFEMLSGELPFRATGVVELMKKHVYEAPPRLSSRVNGLPESLDNQAWRDSQKRWIVKLENTHIELMAATMSGRPDPAVIAQLHKLRDRLETADSPRACVSIRDDLDKWQRTHNR